MVLHKCKHPLTFNGGKHLKAALQGPGLQYAGLFLVFHHQCIAPQVFEPVKIA